jgi:hypothetical protein
MTAITPSLFLLAARRIIFRDFASDVDVTVQVLMMQTSAGSWKGTNLNPASKN